ncbi:hypothetical protein ACHWQZ_G009140 [Mnemiopsis leidyi]
MIAPIVFALLGTALSAVLDPTLTEWRLLKTNEEQVLFPLRDYILEVKSFLPDVYDTNPPYGELFRTDKASTMMMLLHAGSWNNKVGRLVWNTIKYDRGYDVNIEECDARYQAYRSFPAGGKKEQIWAWNFNQDDVELTCDGEVQYTQNFDEGDDNPRKPGLPEKCRALGDAEVDRIIFRHMEGYYIRGVPRDSKKVTTPAPEVPTTPAPEVPTTKEEVLTTKAATEEPTTEAALMTSTPADDPDNVEFDEVYPTCNCWTPECGYCTNLECTVQQDLANSDRGITVTSTLTRKTLNNIVLYNEEGDQIGKFQMSLRGIWLTGCVQCRAPVALRQARDEEGRLTWSFSLKDGVVRITVGEEVLYEQELVGECKEKYSRAVRFAFDDMSCENTFLYRRSEMLAGDKITPDCSGRCSQ